MSFLKKITEKQAVMKLFVVATISVILTGTVTSGCKLRNSSTTHIPVYAYYIHT